MKIRDFAILGIILCGLQTGAFAGAQWTVVIPEEYRGEAAIRIGLEELTETGEQLGITISGCSETESVSGNLIIIGDENLNRYAAKAVQSGKVQLAGMQDEQGFEIVSGGSGDERLIVVAGGSVLGDIYGLYWVWDRLRVHKEIPVINVKRTPYLRIRHVNAENKQSLRTALRYTATWVSGGNVLNLIPWDSEPEKTKNEENRRQLQKLIDCAHDLHLKYMSTCDEITYLPSFFEEFNASLSPDDPALWKALQEKYRRLFTAVPTLDGMRIRTGELTRIFDNYQAYDVMHDRGDSGWSLEDTYRTFVQKMHEVVVGEFDKIYFHRTWVTTANEQHSSAEVYGKIFTNQVPTKNLYLSPYMSLADRWFYQPYNPTFNVTPHNMVVLLSTLDYHAHAGVEIFPTFPGPYYQGGLEKILKPANSNLKGTHFGTPAHEGWDTWSLTAYTAFRLSWYPYENLRDIAKDYASIYYGPRVADTMAEILMFSPQAYKNGVYIKPVAEGIRGNTLPHLRLTTFPVQGFTDLDKGKAHLDWLYATMFKPCENRQDEALAYLDSGHQSIQEMCRLFNEIDPIIEDRDLAQKTGEMLQLARLLIESNQLYVSNCFAYFNYRKNPTSDNRERLAQQYALLQDTVERFLAAPGCIYRVFGIEQLMDAIDHALRNLDEAEAVLAKALDPDAIERAISEQRELHKKAIDTYAGQAKKFLYWEGFVDGRDILMINGETAEIKHIQSDPIVSVRCEFECPLPEKEVTVILEDLESRDIHPFVLEQPCGDNNYTARVYIYDAPGGSGWFKFNLYYVDETPEKLKMQTPW